MTLSCQRPACPLRPPAEVLEGTARHAPSASCHSSETGGEERRAAGEGTVTRPAEESGRGPGRAGAGSDPPPPPAARPEVPGADRACSLSSRAPVGHVARRAGRFGKSPRKHGPPGGGFRPRRAPGLRVARVPSTVPCATVCGLRARPVRPARGRPLDLLGGGRPFLACPSVPGTVTALEAGFGRPG